MALNDANDKVELSLPGGGEPACDGSPVETESEGACLYQDYHRAIWPLLLHLPWVSRLFVEDKDSWRGLLGQIGSELYRCFAFGDSNIRNDMILRARMAGASEIAAKLDRWRIGLEVPRQTETI